MIEHTQTQVKGLILTGLDGSNPLAFLAALGTLRILSLAWPEQPVRMHWVQNAGAWRPTVTGTEPEPLGQDACLDTLRRCLVDRFEDHPISRVLTNGGIAAGETSSISYWKSAMSSDLAPEATSQLQTVRRDYFVGNLKSIIARTGKEHLERALFRLWDYADALENQSLHLDPTEDRRHAYQWNKPSGDPARKKSGGMLGANRLAIESFPLAQSFASGEKLMTRGFRGTRMDNTCWTWPIWSVPLSCDVIGSLLGMASLHGKVSPSQQCEELMAAGLGTAYRCRRILVEKTPNFTPATAVF